MKFDDLLEVPYKDFGRDKQGMDCYGFVLELCRRSGKTLVDIADKSEETIFNLNVIDVRPEDRAPGDLVYFYNEKNELHIGYLLDLTTVIHMTYHGVRLTPFACFNKVDFVRVK